MQQQTDNFLTIGTSSSLEQELANQTAAAAFTAALATIERLRPTSRPAAPRLQSTIDALRRCAAAGHRVAEAHNAIGLCHMVGLHAGGWASHVAAGGQLRKKLAAGIWPEGWVHAAVAFRAAIAEDPNDPRGWHNKAVLQRLAGQFTAAQANARRAFAAAAKMMKAKDFIAADCSHGWLQLHQVVVKMTKARGRGGGGAAGQKCIGAHCSPLKHSVSDFCLVPEQLLGRLIRDRAAAQIQSAYRGLARGRMQVDRLAWEAQKAIVDDAASSWDELRQRRRERAVMLAAEAVADREQARGNSKAQSAPESSRDAEAQAAASAGATCSGEKEQKVKEAQEREKTQKQRAQKGQERKASRK
eukprot:SAG31_NODE_613_length_13545_cov_10.972557_10_plen_358_part_00